MVLVLRGVGAILRNGYIQGQNYVVVLQGVSLQKLDFIYINFYVNCNECTLVVYWLAS